MLSVEDAVLLVIDVQGNLYQAMNEKLFLLENIQKLIKGLKIFGVPIIATEQVPDKLGATIPEVKPLLEGIAIISKAEFNSCKNAAFMNAFKAVDRKEVLVAGIEAHVCVYQTVIHLLDRGYEVHVVADAVSSRTKLNANIALEKMRDEGAQITTTEMVLFELLKTADDSKFKDIIKIVK